MVIRNKNNFKILHEHLFKRAVILSHLNEEWCKVCKGREENGITSSMC